MKKESLDNILSYIYKLKQAAARSTVSKDGEALRNTDQVAELVERISSSQEKAMKDQYRRAQLEREQQEKSRWNDVDVMSTTAQAGVHHQQQLAPTSDHMQQDGDALPKGTVAPAAATSLAGSRRKRREIFKCPHTDRKHYAKNMCHNCYHRKGKTKMAYACGHVDKSHYSNGMCQNCYLAKYYIKRK